MDNVNILVSFEIFPDTSEIADKALAVFYEESKKEPGLVYMYIMRDNDHPAQIFIVEAWKTQRDFETHITSSHFLTFGNAIVGKATPINVRKLLPLG